MKRTTFILISLSLVLAIALVSPGQSAHANQPLPPMSWYAVVWDQGTDTLHWVNANGEAASLSRPHLPNETSPTTADMRISPNGRYLVEMNTLTTGLMAFGIFDFQNGTWVQTHIASPGEEVNLGYRYIFDRNSTHVAISFRVEDYSAPSWHISVYDLASGNEIATLNSGALPNAPTTPQMVRPIVRYYSVDSATGQEVVHFQLITCGTEAAEHWPAYAWQPNTGAITFSPYTRSPSDIHFLTGEEIFAYRDYNYSALPPSGPAPSYNAIGRAMPTSETPSITRIWVDGTAYLYNARWSKGGEWVLFWRGDGTGTPSSDNTWNNTQAVPQPGGNTSTRLGPDVVDVAGTPEGYLKVTTSLAIYHVTDLMDYLNGTLVFQSPGPGPLKIVYVTPVGAAFTLTNVASFAPPVAVVTLQPELVITVPPVAVLTLQPTFPSAAVMCPGAPPPRLTVGQQARVTFTDGTPLRVRATPGGAFQTQIPEGTVVMVIGGPQCQGQYTWWQIQIDNGQQGWSAEGDMEDYYLEPWSALAPPPALPTPSPVPPIGAVATTPPLVIAPPAMQIVGTVPPLVGQAVLTVGDCSQAPPTRLQMDMVVITASLGGTYALFANLEDPTPYRQVPPNTTATIIGESSCKNGYRFWPVSLALNGQQLTGWLSEGTQQRYFLIPLNPQ